MSARSRGRNGARPKKGEAVDPIADRGVRREFRVKLPERIDPNSRQALMIQITQLKEEIRLKDQRIAALEAVGDRLLTLYGNEWSDTDQQVALRTLRAILEHRPHLPLAPLKEHKKTP